MIITATTRRLRVDTRTAGKSYSESSEINPNQDTAERSVYPFDSRELNTGESLTLSDDVELVGVKRLGDNAQPTEQPSGA